MFQAIGLDSCPEPQAPSNGARLGDRYIVGDVISFQCEQGFSLKVGERARERASRHVTRDVTAQWSGRGCGGYDEGVGVYEWGGVDLKAFTAASRDTGPLRLQAMLGSTPQLSVIQPL